MDFCKVILVIMADCKQRWTASKQKTEHFTQLRSPHFISRESSYPGVCSYKSAQAGLGKSSNNYSGPWLAAAAALGKKLSLAINKNWKEASCHDQSWTHCSWLQSTIIVPDLLLPAPLVISGPLSWYILYLYLAITVILLLFPRSALHCFVWSLRPH